MQDAKQSKIILDLCGGTGSWSNPYKDNGYDVRVITLPQDVRLFKFCEKVYGILAAPPCTMFSLAGNRWRYEEKQKGIYDKKMIDAISIVDACFRFISVCRPIFWALENPVGTLSSWLGKPKMYFQPYDYGDRYSKKTALWGNFNIPTKNPVEPIPPKVKGKPDWHHNCVGKPPDMDRMTWRSITPKGFAQAFYEANK